MRISDWSSDVCSSDLDIGVMVYVGRGLRAQISGKIENCLIDPSLPVARRNADHAGDQMPYWPSYSEIPPTSNDRKSVVSGQSVSVRLDLGGRRIINKKIRKTPLVNVYEL